MTKYGSFGKRDIALLLPDQVGDVISYQTNEEEVDKFEPLKPKVDLTKKILRYRPGQKPVYIKENDNNNDINRGESKNNSVSNVDKRLARLSQTNISNNDNNTTRRRVYEAQVIKSADDDEDNDKYDQIDQDNSNNSNNIKFNIDSDDINEVKDDIVSRRERALRRLAESESKDITTTKSIENNSEESESEYETDTDEEEDDEEVEAQPLKPLFIPKHLRETIKAKEAEEEQQALRKSKEIEEELERKKQTRGMLAESIKRIDDEKILDKDDNNSEYGKPDDTDDPNDIIEYEKWKIRELTRLRRDALLREQHEIEKKEVERRRLLTEEERLLEDKKLGVFYMDESTLDDNDVRKRDYSQPTLEDKINKEKLPTVLQVKNFGKKGRTKYTHLVDQDTTDFKTDVRPIQPIIEKYMNKRSGIGEIDTSFKRKKI
eukprot:gene21703-28086_t